MLPDCALILGRVGLERSSQALLLGTFVLGGRGGGPGLGARPGSRARWGDRDLGEGLLCYVAVRASSLKEEIHLLWGT